LGCSWFVSAGVAALGSGFLAAAVDATCNFADFTADNDPYGEHDFGAFEMDGQRVFWKIDYYDQTITAGSPDAADPSLTKRVLTIMLASEY
jgi:hypothetical protein